MHVSSAAQLHQYLPRRVDTIRSTCRGRFQRKCISFNAILQQPFEGFRESSRTSAQSGSISAPSQLNVAVCGRCIVAPFPQQNISIGNNGIVLLAARCCARKDDGRGLFPERCSMLHNSTRPGTGEARKLIAEILHTNVNSFQFLLGLVDCMACV